MKRLIVLSLVALSSAFGYITQTLSTGGQNYTLKRANATDMTYYLDDQVTVNLKNGATNVFSPGSDPMAAAKAALAAWNGVSTANIHFNTLTSITSPSTGPHDPSDCKNVIAFASSADDIAAVGGALAVTLPFYSATSGTVCNGSLDVTPGVFYDADILFSPAFAFSTDKTANTIDFQSVLTHELGHSMGANHSAVVGSTMYWTTSMNQYNQRVLSSDDIGFVSSVYPLASANWGTLNGTVSLANSSPVKYGLLTAIDRTTGKTYGGLTGSDGTFSITAPAGSYIIYAEPFNNFISTKNIYTATGSLDAGQVTTGYLPTFLGGSANPTATTVAAGATATISLTVTSGTSALTPPFYGIGAPGALGDIPGTLPGLGAAISIASGQSIDLAFIGGGVDDNTSFLVFGRGISIKAGSIRSDPKFTVPMRRFTLDIPAQTDTTLASLWIVKGNDVLAYTGGLVITGSGGDNGGSGGTGGGSTPAPTFTSASIVNAASYGGAGTVSPGELVSIYDTTSLSLGPAQAAVNSSYDSSGKLPTSAGGVSVTFNGVAAPIYFAASGQINLQVPFEVSSGSTAEVVVTYNGVKSAAVTVNVAAATPSFFTITPLGTDAIIQNFPSYSLNNASNPAARGDVVLLYGTGIGKLSYPLGTGQAGTVPPSSYTSAWTCSFGGKSASAYAYWNYGFVGEATWTVGVPTDAPAGAVDLTCTDSVSGAVTPKGTIYLK